MSPSRVQGLELLRIGVRSSRNHNLELHWDHMVYLMETHPVVFYIEMKIFMDRNWKFHWEQWIYDRLGG